MQTCSSTQLFHAQQKAHASPPPTPRWMRTATLCCVLVFGASTATGCASVKLTPSSAVDNIVFDGESTGAVSEEGASVTLFGFSSNPDVVVQREGEADLVLQPELTRSNLGLVTLALATTGVLLPIGAFAGATAANPDLVFGILVRGVDKNTSIAAESASMWTVPMMAAGIGASLIPMAMLTFAGLPDEHLIIDVERGTIAADAETKKGVE